MEGGAQVAQDFSAEDQGAKSPNHDNVVVLKNLDSAMRRRGPSANMAELAEHAGVPENIVRGVFPQGRAQLVEAIIGGACSEFDDVVTGPMLTAPTPREALQEAADGLAAYYEGGARHCLFELFSVPGDTDHGELIKDTAKRFLDALILTLTRMGKAPDAAEVRAKRVLAELQGTLILGRLTEDPSLFRAFTDSLARMR